MAKLKRINLGKREPEVCCMPEKSKKSTKVHYPSFYIHNKKLPIEPEDVGSTITATVELKVTGVNMRTDEEKQNFNYDFDVHEIVFNKNGRQ
jgi:hypothetical protein